MEQLQRYTNQELTEIAKEIFYDYLSDEKDGIPNVKEVFDVYQNRLEKYEAKLQQYIEKISKSDTNEALRQALNMDILYLEETIPHIKNACMKYQKDLYERTKRPNFCRSSIRIPLNKKINSFYDDLILEVLFYDDVCTPKGKITEYNMLSSKAQRKDFLKANTQITNMGLVFLPQDNTKILIQLFGNINQKTDLAEMFDSKFSDFENLTLADINLIENNDLKQFFQEKIDLDKENLTKLSSQIIRGDLYEIFKTSEDDFYIRYICRSTGRVYYNLLNLVNLRISDFFKENDYDSYAKAWWNLNTLGENPEGEDVIRC